MLRKASARSLFAKSLLSKEKLSPSAALSFALTEVVQLL